ncbi:MAG: hypothetical protein FWG82_03125 [Oscillospiraceae bacterium]|nr:hypothetical protein [Oscillospiraceae bacterium]
MLENKHKELSETKSKPSFWRKITKTAVIILALTLGLTLLFTTLMTAVFLLPNERIEENAIKSLNIIKSEAEGSNPSFFPKIPALLSMFYMPNVEYIATTGGKAYYGFTGSEGLALMIMNGENLFDMYKYADEEIIESYESGELRKIFDSMATGEFTDVINFDELEKLSTEESLRLLISAFMENAYGFVDSPTETLLQKAVVASYPRYWHGYVLLYRPLMYVENIAFLRLITFTLTLFALAVLLFLMGRRFKLGVTLVFAFAFSLVQILILPREMLFFFAFFIMYIACAIVLWRYERIREKGWDIYFFFIVGSLTAFFDTLTSPLLTLLTPLGFYVFLNLQNKEIKLKENVMAVFNSVIGWGLGYGLLSASKWVVASLVTGESVIKNSIASLTLRMGGTSELSGYNNSNRTEAIEKNLSWITQFPAFWLYFSILALVACTVYCILKRKKNFEFVINSYMLLPIAIAPFMWYALLPEHSVAHQPHTYRLLAATVFALGLLFIQLWSGGDSHAVLQSVKTPKTQNPDDTAEADEIVENSANADIKQALTAAKAGVIKFSQRFKNTKKPPSKNPYAKTAQKGSGKKKKKKR